MDPFIGTWKFIQGEGYDKYLSATGADEEMIEVSKLLNPVVTISQEDELIVIQMKTALGSENMTFKLGKEFYVEKRDGRYCKSVVDLKEDQLILLEKWGNKEAISTIEVKDGQLIKKITFKDISAVQIFEKV